MRVQQLSRSPPAFYSSRSRTLLFLTLWRSICNSCSTAQAFLWTICESVIYLVLSSCIVQAQLRQTPGSLQRGSLSTQTERSFRANPYHVNSCWTVQQPDGRIDGPRGWQKSQTSDGFDHTIKNPGNDATPAHGGWQCRKLLVPKEAAQRLHVSVQRGGVTPNLQTLDTFHRAAISWHYSENTTTRHHSQPSCK
jgi:hypothetical protein